MNSRVDAIIAEEKRWKREFETLRALMLETGLAEDVKWGQPCYTREGRNVALFHGFKEYCAILFMKGALLKDERRILTQQTDSVQASRQLRFTSVAEIERQADAIREYMREAIEVEKAGLKVEFKETKEFAVPEELNAAFEADAAFREAFYALTPGRQRAYLLHFSQPKQSATRTARIEKHAPRIFDGLGLND